MGATKIRLGLFGLGMLLLGSLVVVDSVWAQGRVSFIASQEFGVGGSGFHHCGRLQWRWPPGSGHRQCGANTVSILLGRAMAPSRPPSFGVETASHPSQRAISMAMATRISPRRILAPTACPSCWAMAMAPSRPPQLWGGSGYFCPSRGRFQWRWPPGSGHGQSGGQYRVDFAGPGRWHLPGCPRCCSRSGSSAITGGDFNGDGHPDLATAMPCRSVSILLGQGDGTFAAGPDFGGGRGSCVRHGGRLQWRWPPRSGHRQCNVDTVSILLGQGDGTFQPPQRWGGRGSCAIMAGDFNGDGHLDLATANRFADTVSILLGQGDGTFQPPRLWAGQGPLFSHRGRLQWRWPPRSGHRECGAGTVSILLGGAMAPSGAPEVGVDQFPCSITGGRLQWRWPPRSGHG